MRRVALFFALAASAAALIGGGSATGGTAKADLSTRAGVVSYLVAHGIDPTGIVIQRGAHNYAGPSCPGRGWTCTTAARVVQISTKGSDNDFQCTPSSGGFVAPPNQCTIVQVSATGKNDARCVERTGDTAAAQRCVVLQTNTAGDNRAEVRQVVDANAGPTQDANQYTGIEQQNGSGSNFSHVLQDLKQSTKETDSSGTQTQDGHQGVSVTQDADVGDNTALVEQSLAQKAKASGGASITQNQNTGSGGPNTNAGIEQSSTMGRNEAHLNQSHDLDATASGAGTTTQQQGTQDDGLNGHFDQSSAGLSTVKGSQKEAQRLQAEHAGTLTQTQYGPAQFGSEQGSNPNDVYDIDQSSTQHASDPTLQSEGAFGNCDTSGNCTFDQRIQQNHQTQTNSCAGTSCHTGLIVTTTPEGTTVSTCSGLPSEDQQGTCPFPPPPPPPPIGGDCGLKCVGSPDLRAPAAHRR
jgi:hypothetical protein